MGKSLLSEKSEDYGVRVIKFYEKLISINHYDIGRQFLRCGTSIGANIAESVYAQSSMDFVHKLSISLKEANETQYWLKILLKSGIISNDTFESYNGDLKEIIAMLIASIRTVKRNGEIENK